MRACSRQQIFITVTPLGASEEVVRNVPPDACELEAVLECGLKVRPMRP